METCVVRILVVDDYQLWLRFISSELQKQPHLQVIDEASDGLTALQKAQELQLDLVLLDIGLPKLNGIDVARRIRETMPRTKILFVSENRDCEVAQEALRTGHGYVVKSYAGRELLPAIETVLRGGIFISEGLAAVQLTALQSS